MNPARRYRRIILHFGDGPVSERSIGATAEIARLLGLVLHAVFVEDEVIFNLAALPFGREIRLPTHEWQPMEPERIAHDYRHAAQLARERVQRAAEVLGIAYTFDVMRGDPSACIAAIAQADDIIVAAAPSRRTATASTLFIPSAVQPRDGPVVAVALSERDPSLELAAAIAQALGTSVLTVLPPPGSAHRLAAADVAARLAGVRERLVVLCPDAADELEAIGHASGVPVLVVRP